MSYNSKSLKRDSDSLPVPQYYNSEMDDFEPAQGSRGAISVQQIGGFVRKSTESMPNEIDDGVSDGDTLLLIDTKQVYKYYAGEWWEL